MIRSQSGNVLFLILIAVALFAALSYAVTNSSRSGSGNTDTEQQKLDQAVIDNYLAAITAGQITLDIARGCGIINYDPPSEWSGSDFDCHMFHPDGAGVAYQDLGIDTCIENGSAQNLSVGESCGNIVYAGESSGNRIYTTLADQGTASWNNGTTNYTIVGIPSTSDGLTNTNTLLALSDVGAPYQAATICRVLGADWYLPARSELNLLYTNKNEGALSGTFNESGANYWTSTENSAGTGARIQRFNDGDLGTNNKQYARIVRCVRRD